MRSFRVPILTFLSLTLFALPQAHGQETGFAGGVFASFGFETPHSPGMGCCVIVPLVGAYVEWLHPRIHPGLDVRGEAGTLGVTGTLVGPRASMTFGRIHPYAEILIGPNHADFEPPGGGPPAPDTDRHGITTQGAIGLELDTSPHVRWRIIEFSQSSFSGIPNSYPRAFTSGIVFHIP